MRSKPKPLTTDNHILLSYFDSYDLPLSASEGLYRVSLSRILGVQKNPPLKKVTGVKLARNPKGFLLKRKLLMRESKLRGYFNAHQLPIVTNTRPASQILTKPNKKLIKSKIFFVGFTPRKHAAEDRASISSRVNDLHVTQEVGRSVWQSVVPQYFTFCFVIESPNGLTPD